MGNFQVRYDSRDVIYNRRAFIRLATGHTDFDPSWRSTSLLFYNSLIHPFSRYRPNYFRSISHPFDRCLEWAFVVFNYHFSNSSLLRPTRVTRCWNGKWPNLNQKLLKKWLKQFFSLKVSFFIIAQKVGKHLGYFCTKICCKDRSKVPQSGHTASYLLSSPVRSMTSFSVSFFYPSFRAPFLLNNSFEASSSSCDAAILCRYFSYLFTNTSLAQKLADTKYFHTIDSKRAKIWALYLSLFGRKNFLYPFMYSNFIGCSENIWITKNLKKCISTNLGSCFCWRRVREKHSWHLHSVRTTFLKCVAPWWYKNTSSAIGLWWWLSW